jgi:chloride channel 7
MQAAFGAPIGGVLFAMEEASSFWSRKVAWRCFVAAVCAAFMMSFANASEANNVAGRGIIHFENVHVLRNSDWVRQFPFMVVVAALGGTLGQLFNKMRRMLWKVRASRQRKVLRVMEAVATVLFCVIVQFVAVTYFGSCRKIPDTWPDDFKVCAQCCRMPDDIYIFLFEACE